MKIADPNLVPHRERFEAAVPPDSIVKWHIASASTALSDDLRDAEVFVGGRFTEMAAAADKLRLVHAAGADTDKIAFESLSPDVLVANTFHHEQSIAEYAIAAAVLLRRDFLGQDRNLRRNVWATSVYDSTLPNQVLCKARVSGLSASAISDSERGSCSAPSVAPVRPLRARETSMLPRMAWPGRQM